MYCKKQKRFVTCASDDYLKTEWAVMHLQNIEEKLVFKSDGAVLAETSVETLYRLLA